MKLEIIDYKDLIDASKIEAHQKLEHALLTHGIVGVRDVPGFVQATENYLAAARQFGQLPADVKAKYIPDRDSGKVEGYELGAEKFKMKNGEWVTDDKKGSYYAMIPDEGNNLWPTEVDLCTPYMALGKLLLNTSLQVMNVIGLNESVNVTAENTSGHGRMLHYQTVRTEDEMAANWCGAHYDHSLFTGLIPAHYFKDGVAVQEPEDAGLYIVPHHSDQLEKVNVPDKSIMLFQAGEFGQIISNDRIHATQHLVKKSPVGTERFSFALFVNIVHDYVVKTTSELINDPRFKKAVRADGSLTYGDWRIATYDRYRV